MFIHLSLTPFSFLLPSYNFSQLRTLAVILFQHTLIREIYRVFLQLLWLRFTQNLDAPAMQQLLFSIQQQLCDLQRGMNKRFDHLEQQLVACPPRTPGGPKSPDSPPNSEHNPLQELGSQIGPRKNNPFIDSPPYANSTTSEETTSDTKFTMVVQGNNGCPTDITTANPRHLMYSLQRPNSVTPGTPPTVPESPTSGGYGFSEDETKQLEEAVLVINNVIQLSPNDSKLLYHDQLDQALGSPVPFEKSEDTAISAKETAIDMTSDDVDTMSNENTVVPASGNYNLSLPLGGSQLSFCNSSSTDPTLPQNRPDKDDFCYGPTYHTLIHGSAQTQSMDDVKNGQVLQSTDLTMPQFRSDKDHSCYGPSYHALVHSAVTEATNKVEISQSTLPTPTAPQNLSDNADEPPCGALVHGMPSEAMQNTEAGKLSIPDPTMPQNRPEKDEFNFGHLHYPLVPAISEPASVDSAESAQSRSEMSEHTFSLEGLEPLSDLTDGTNGYGGNDNSDVVTAPPSMRKIVELNEEGLEIDSSSEDQPSNDGQESISMAVTQMAVGTEQLSPKEQIIKYIIEELTSISKNHQLSALQMISNSLKVLFSRGTRLASEFYQAIDTAACCHPPSSRGKIDVYPISDAGDGRVPWDSPGNACIFPLLLAMKARDRSTEEVDHRVIDTIEQVNTETKDFVDNLRAKASASLLSSFRAAKKAAQSQGKTTLLFVWLRDLHSHELATNSNGRAKEIYTSFHHNFILGVGPQGGVLWQSWGEGKHLHNEHRSSTSRIPGAFGFDEWIANGGADLRSWTEMEAWVASFEKMANLKGSKWTNQHNKLYKRCFGPDLTKLCFPQGKLLGMCPKIRSEVMVQALDDVTLEDVTKFEFKL